MTDHRALYPSLSGRVVIVTGGGRGIGREMALALVGAGASVAITGSRETSELADTVAAAEERAGPGRMIAVRADVRDGAACERVRDETLAAFGSVQCLVNNAGLGMRAIRENFVEDRPRFWEAPLEGWRDIVDTNINGPFAMARAITPHFLERGLGKIVNISTSDLTMVRVGYSPYGPTKAALEAMTRIWAQDLDGTGVTANVLLPGGATDTRFLPEGPRRAGADGHLLSPAIMRAPALWLCSDRSDHHTGERYIARLWDESLPPDEAAAAARDVHHPKPGIL